MRHRKQKVTLGRESAQRSALIRGLAETFILHESIVTTRAKAKALRLFVEPMVTRAKVNSLANRRLLLKRLYTDAAVNKLLSVIGPRYIERPGGYTRTTKLGTRQNDAADMVKIEFV